MDFTTSPEDFQVDEEAVIDYERNHQQLQAEEAARQAQQKEAAAAEQKAQAEQDAKIDPKTGRPKSTHETLDAKQYGFGENAQEAVNAVGGGLVDAANSVLSLPKFLDPKFYQKGEEYKPPFAQIEKPITKTVWGNVIRTGVEFISLAAVTRGGARGLAAKAPAPLAKGLNWYGGNKTSVAGKLVQGAVSGAVTDVISTQSQQTNLSAELIKLKPEWEDSLKSFATNENMSPAQRSLYNIVEGMGIGVVADAAMEGLTAGFRGLRGARNAVSAQINDPELSKLWNNRKGEALKQAEDLQYQNQTLKVEGLAKQRIYRIEYNNAKKQGLIHPEMSLKDYLSTNPKSAWNGMSAEDKLVVMEEVADVKGIAWGTKHRATARQRYQEEVTATRAVDEINRNPQNYVQQELDLDSTPPRQSFDVIDGGDVTQGANSSATDNVFHGIRDQHRIRTEWDQEDGSPRGGVTSAQVARIAYGAPGQSVEELKRMAKDLNDSPEVQAIRSSTTANEADPLQDFQDAEEFLADFFSSRSLTGPSQVTAADLTLDGPIFQGKTTTYGLDGSKSVTTVSSNGVAVIDLLASQLMKEARDAARLGGSISDHVDLLEQDGVGRTIYERLVALARLRAESTAMSSYNLSALGKPRNADEVLNTIADRSDNAAQLVDSIFKAVREDTDDNLLNLYIDALSKSDKYTNINDLHEAMHRNLWGYTEGDQVQRNAILRELNSTMIHSFLSGPRTVTRATFSTGFNTFMRPIATIVGGSGSYITGNDRTVRTAMYELGGMLDAVGESWDLVKRSWNAQIGKELPNSPSGLSETFETIEDIKWQQQGAFFMVHGSDGEKAAWLTANTIRGLNNNPIFSWGTKAMQAADDGWRHLIARGRLKAMAFNEAYDTLVEAGRTASDADIQKMLPEISENLHSRIWAEDGRITDELAKMAADEVTMTKELQGFGKKLDEAFASNAFLRPFLLFARTTGNSLILTGKHIPILNNFIKEVHDIKNLDINVPANAQILESKYGIRTPEELAGARALIRGREAIAVGTVSAVSMAYMNGTITGNGPPDREIRDTWMQMGWRPRSIKIGGKYISYDALEPLNSIMSTVADIGDASLEMGEEWAEQQLGRIAYILGMNVTNKSFMTGLTQLVDVVQMKGNKPAMVAASLANGLIPLAGARNEMGRLLAPGMRELQAGFTDSVRNRNLWSDVVTPDGAHLPYKYDILNGSKLQDYDFMTRAFNAVSPFQMNLGTTPTRDLLFRSLFDVKTTVNSGPNGEALTATMKSKYQYLIGKQNIEAQLDILFQNPDIVKSIIDMESDRSAGRRYDASTTLHNTKIKELFDTAKRTAWMQMKFGDVNVAKEVRNAALTKQAGERRKAGSSEDANAILNMRNK